MTTERAAVREAARRLSAKDSAARECARGGTPDVRAYAHWGAAEDGKGKARQRSLRWMELGWEGANDGRAGGGQERGRPRDAAGARRGL